MIIPLKRIRCNSLKDVVIVVVETFVARNSSRERRGRSKARTRTSASGQSMKTIVGLGAKAVSISLAQRFSQDLAHEKGRPTFAAAGAAVRRGGGGQGETQFC